MDLHIIGLLIFSTISWNSWLGHGQNTFDVLKYGAKGDGHSDDTQAFVRAWKYLCGASKGTPKLVLAASYSFFVDQTTFQGPCKSQKVDIEIQGTVLAPTRKVWGACSKRWLQFTGVDGMTLHGSGVIDGRGDDCIAIKGGSQFINVTRVTCGPGHGISVGSLGEGGSYEFAEHVNVNGCIFNGATSAAKIKTWPGGKGYAKDITFQNISVNRTDYPIFIDQHYMLTPEQKQALKVSDVTFNNIHGTSSSENAVVLDCANIGCDNIILKQINITSIDPKKPAISKLNNAHGSTTDIISPPITGLHN
ncbi:hypothetical protein RJT34_16667 [Clitoria ternatea]|uniref:Polygalacturonase n=1 Tax=Clitoria ternatea TaxID=43366 RepID=A0AAN9PCI4_CLITE